jgi:flagellar biosynthesis/type III secretory pathway chaperone
MNTASTELQAFTTSVQRTLGVLQRLEAALAAEQAALTGSDAEQLQQAVRAKLTVLTELEPLLSERDAIQQRLGMAKGPAGGDQLLAGAPADAPVCQQWEALKQHAANVEKLNARNGQLAVQGEKTARLAVSLLTGRPAETETYGRSGHGKTGLGGLSLAKA